MWKPTDIVTEKRKSCDRDVGTVLFLYVESKEKEKNVDTVEMEVRKVECENGQRTMEVRVEVKKSMIKGKKYTIIAMWKLSWEILSEFG